MVKHSVILLDRDFRRLRNVKNNIQKRIPNLEIQTAFDYKKQNPLSFCEANEISICEEYLENRAKLGGLANLISHIKIWKQMLDEGISEMVIMEDDAQINSGHFVFLDNVRKELPTDYSICLLYVSKNRQFKKDKQKVKIHKKNFIEKGYKNYGMVAYLISLAGAESMLKDFKKISYLIDVQINHLLKTGNNKIFCAKNPFVSVNMLPTNVLNTERIK